MTSPDSQFGTAPGAVKKSREHSACNAEDIVTRTHQSDQQVRDDQRPTNIGNIR